MWASSDPAWVGKASMSKRHCLLTIKDLNWEWFNVLTFGLISGLDCGIEKLEAMKAAALLWASNMKDWPPVERLGLFLHVYAHCSVNSMHLHMVDMANLGPTYYKLEHKNLPIDDAIQVLREERSQGL